VAGGSRLGGGGKYAGLTPKEMAARVSATLILWFPYRVNSIIHMQAAEQRARDEKSCASGTLAQREAEKAAKASVESKVIDLTLDDMDDYIYSDFDQDIVIIDDDEGTSRYRRNSSPESSKGWSCTACTFINFASLFSVRYMRLGETKDQIYRTKGCPTFHKFEVHFLRKVSSVLQSPPIQIGPARNARWTTPMIFGVVQLVERSRLEVDWRDIVKRALGSIQVRLTDSVYRFVVEVYFLDLVYKHVVTRNIMTFPSASAV
jgi:hypothetical protein